MRNLWIAIVSMALGGSTAQAGTLTTTALLAGPLRTPVCRIANLGAKPAKNVAVTLLQIPNGSPGAIAGTGTFPEIAALEARVVGSDQPIAAISFYACRFVFRGSAKSLRASIAIFDDASEEIWVEPAR